MSRKLSGEAIDNIRNAIDVLNDIVYAMTEMVSDDTSEPMTQICREYGMDYVKVRRLVDAAIKCRINKDDQIKIDLPVLQDYDGYEGLYAAIFGISYEELRMMTPDSFPADLMETVNYCMENFLNSREYDILSARFGINGHLLRKTLDEVGNMCGVTGSCIRDIEYKALRKLRKPESSRRLRLGLHNYEIEEKRNDVMEKLEREIEGPPEKLANSIISLMKSTRLEGNPLELGPQLYDALTRPHVGIISIYDIYRMPVEELKSIRGFGVSSYDNLLHYTRLWAMQRLNKNISITDIENVIKVIRKEK